MANENKETAKVAINGQKMSQEEQVGFHK